MTALKCVVEGCNLEYDVICSFSFYNVNIGTDKESKRQQWIEGAMQEEKECLWRHVSLQLCGYHFELDSQGLWIDSPMLPELLTLQDHEEPKIIPTEEDKRLAELIRKDHNYCAEPKPEQPADISRLNVRQLVDTLGYLSLKSLQRKQLWVVKVETDKSEASITQSEQVITKMADPKQVIEILPNTSTEANTSGEMSTEVTEESSEVLMMDDSIADNFIYEIAEEQEISMEEVKEIQTEPSRQWTVNIVPEEAKPKYAYIKHCSTGKKKRHFTTEMNEITLEGDYENYYILPDEVDPSSGVEVTTSGLEPESFVVGDFQDYVIQPHTTTSPTKRSRESDPTKKRKKKVTPMREQVKEIQIKNELGEDWVIQNAVVYDPDASDDYDDKKSRVRRKNKKYCLDFVT